ncbi:MAG TPA: TetR/AcrR family transcriptional regulator [Anaerolineae bacterium]|nr:TetR/AcrR family transcriptional regulator [Anaerolineae bacterium]
MAGTDKNRYKNIILESARLFREKGYLATSIRDIGDALGITSAALYYHFKNKEELLVEVMLGALRNLHRSVTEAISAETDPAKQIQIAMRTHLRSSTDHQDFAIVLLQEVRHLSPKARLRVVEQRDAYEAIWTDLFAKGAQANLYKPDVDIRLLRLLTFGAINLVVTWYKPTGTYKPEQIADALYKIAAEGVLHDH